MKQRQRFMRCWQLGCLGILAWLGAIAFPHKTLAQSNIVPDNTLGAESSLVIPNYQGLPIEVIAGGAVRGGNLFHSFRDFNVSTGRGAYFFSPDVTIQNILARVTGSNISEIRGILGTFGRSQPNLFLINPNGIIFGQNASLDLGGSFVATTADAIQFGTQGFFRVTTPNPPPPILTVNPSALLFNQISNKGITYSAGVANLVDPSLVDGLKVVDGHSLLLVGGNINLDGGVVKAPGGRVELGGLASSGTVGLNIDGNSLRLNFPEGVAQANVSLTNQATVDVSGEGSGSVVLQGDRVTLTNGVLINSINLGSKNAGEIVIRASQLEFQGNSAINSSTAGSGKGGDVNIQTGSLNIRDNSTILTNSIFAPGKAGNLTIAATDSVNLVNQGILATLSIGTGDGTTSGTGGNISIKTKNLALENTSGILVSSFLGTGNVGNLSIQATNSVNSALSSIISTSSFGAGNGGDISIDTKNLRLQTGAGIFTNTFEPKTVDLSRVLPFLNPSLATALNTLISNINLETVGKANSGNLTITASDLIEVIGTSADGKSSSGFSTEIFGAGNGGNLTIATRQLRVLEGGVITTSTRPGSQGKGGNLVINASDLVELSGFSANGVSPPGLSDIGLFTQTEGTGDAGDLTVTTGRLIVRDGALISAQTSGQGFGGNIQLKANSLTLRDRATITSRSEGQKKAGNIDINLRDTLEANNSKITTSATQGGGGDISITAQNIRLRSNSDIRTDLSKGQGSGGNIFITADSIIALEDSDILAFAPEGQGGNIKFNTRVFLSSPLYQITQTPTDAATLQALDGNSRVDVNASGAVSGSIIGLPDTTFLQNSLKQLPQNLIDPNTLIAKSCIARRNNPQGGTFFITGKGGLPERPGDAPLSPYLTGTLRSIPQVGESAKSSTSTTPPSQWKIGDPIVEPQGVYRLTNGQLVMSRECDSGS